jgi:hypothetical protein
MFLTGNYAQLNHKAMLGRLQMSLDSMKSDMSNNCSNIAAIWKYAMACKSLVEHPDRRLNELLSRH